ncbi:bifunctional 2',3'-cyclic-nucleotide 2'-phosphodiesterase/3'-nucleotidase [Rhodovulum kholense]|uniref:2',3'-cyclic-nucleotide 2'-phosphodiesterase/3'-nucleotidase n=1 Tax=Rhodovulum kholense TaxID=453584 RepID=A0A8E2VIS4_9RHOB|nr:bifunctional 2',3'-cyclic-nucleotide 2'-phosphodiesterase/3'-nucleotidase [Rhodovulum kholense]PTW48315.1 2',3'-cyclic-nucleotide 2'-phosphodiesterase/3'-nucleotidase [Rhodovulum kholense]
MNALHPFSASPAADRVHLRLMETSDLHVHVFPYDYYSDRPIDSAGLARTAALIATLRAEAANTLLFDNGDFLQGNPMGDYIAHERGLRPGEMHPMIAAMNAVGYDAATLGNHDFNYGLDFLLTALDGARFPVVSANLLPGPLAPPGLAALPRYTLLDRTVRDGAGQPHPLRIGVIGFLPPPIAIWDRRHLHGRAEGGDIVAAARALVPRMRADGADLVVALAHSGIGEPDHVDRQENACLPLAGIEGIDAILSGHQHMTLPGPDFAGIPGVDAEAGTICGKPAVMPGFWGSHLGVVDLLLERGTAGWRVAEHRSAVHPIAHRKPGRGVVPLVSSNPEVITAAAPAHAETLAYTRRAVGRTEVPLHSYFSLVTNDASVKIVADAQRWYLAEMLKGTRHEGLPLLSAAAPFKAGGHGGPDYYTDVPAGDIAIRNVADLYLYPNTVRAVRVTGAQLRGWLERSAALFNRIEPGQPDQILLNPEAPCYNFDVICGVEYRIDLSRPPRFGPGGRLLDPTAGRISGLSWQGQPVTDDMEFVVATNSFRASGGGGFPGTGVDTVAFEAPDANRDVLLRYIAEHGTVAPRADATWRFEDLPGTTVLFDTSPAALDHLDELRDLALEPAENGPDGFLRLRIAL